MALRAKVGPRARVCHLWSSIKEIMIACKVDIIFTLSILCTDMCLCFGQWTPQIGMSATSCPVLFVPFQHAKDATKTPSRRLLLAVWGCKTRIQKKKQKTQTSTSSLGFSKWCVKAPLVRLQAGLGVPREFLTPIRYSWHRQPWPQTGRTNECLGPPCLFAQIRFQFKWQKLAEP